MFERVLQLSLVWLLYPPRGVAQARPAFSPPCGSSRLEIARFFPPSCFLLAEGSRTLSLGVACCPKGGKFQIINLLFSLRSRIWDFEAPLRKSILFKISLRVIRTRNGQPTGCDHRPAAPATPLCFRFDFWLVCLGCLFPGLKKKKKERKDLLSDFPYFLMI